MKRTGPVVTLALTLMLSLGFALSAVAKTPSIRLVGFLTEQGDKLCPGNWKIEWVNPHFEVGFVRIVGSDLDLKPLVGKAVVATGHRLKDHTLPVVKHKGECPIPQMRSDWVEGMNGMRVRRTGGSGLQLFHVTSAQALPDFSAIVEGEELVVTYTRSTFGPDLELTVHYEGCYGKPGSVTATRKLTKVEAGGTATVRFPTIKGRRYDQPRKGIDPGRHDHVAVSLEVEGPAPAGVVLDFDVPLRSYGVKLSCPRR